jgi:hypothetical protein
LFASKALALDPDNGEAQRLCGRAAGRAGERAAAAA